MREQATHTLIHSIFKIKIEKDDPEAVPVDLDEKIEKFVKTAKDMLSKGYDRKQCICLKVSDYDRFDLRADEKLARK